MMRMPRHLADAEAGPAAALPRIEGLDLETVAANVERLGGDRGRFAERLAAAADAGIAGEPELARAAIALVAWRAGVLALRDEALSRLRQLPASRHDVAAASLGLAPEAVGEFALRQESDRYWWPDRARWDGYVCAVGGFAGLGGSWIEPPEDGRSIVPVGERLADGPPVARPEPAGPSSFAVRTGEAWWRIDADVWGSRLTRTGTAPVPSAAMHTARVTLVTRPDSYLAWIHVREAA